MRLTEFDGVSLPANGVDVSVPRAVSVDLLVAAGGAIVDKDVYQTPISQQQYSSRFMYSAVTQSALDALYGKLGKWGRLKRLMRDGSTRFANAKLTNIDAPMNNFDYLASVQKITATWLAEPLWYADTATTVSFTSVTRVSLRSNQQGGNARATKFVVLTITSAITSGFMVTIEPNGASYYGEFTYGNGIYGPLRGEFPCSLTYGASANGLIVDAGAGTVRSNNADVYANASKPNTQTALLWLEPGDSVIRFNQTVSGNIVFRSTWA